MSGSPQEQQRGPSETGMGTRLARALACSRACLDPRFIVAPRIAMVTHLVDYSQHKWN